MESPAPTRSAPPRGLLLLAFAAVFLVWGTTFLAIRYAVETIPPLLTAGVRHAVAGTVLLALAWLRGYRPRRSDWIAGSVIGALFFLAGHGLLHWAELHIASGLAALLIATEPMWILVLGAAFGRQRLSWASGLGLLLGLAGVALLTLPELGTVRLVDWGILATLASSLAWSLGVVASPLLKLPAHPLGRAAVATLTGSAMLLSLAALTGEIAAFDPGAVSLRSVLGLAYLITFGSVITFSAYSWLLQHTSPALVATHTFVNPVVAIFVGWMWAGEPLGRQLALAAAAIVAAVVLVQRGERLGARDEEPPASTE
ncbi:MAG TPA: EamA family transporter [Thermoanaerobaculaceae bacterium]|nr:EamA family transporter [Thermoanaerobaculaceae bacterium]HPS79158.1 EamA family transporter [Thermoanaerobaculaceae bacterium]